MNKFNFENLPPLTGTQKQVIWAEKIRESLIRHWTQESEPYQMATVEALKIVSDAKVFIEWPNRHEEENLARALRKAAKKISPEYKAKFDQRNYPIGFGGE